ncbi:hypothetical protein QJQ45_008070 [Haematococcus lacustris]|nr:hypothetical protein QJQ45_008070 [Haematococcus lacustris]
MQPAARDPKNISRFYDRDMSAALNIRAVQSDQDDAPLSCADGMAAQLGRPGQEWVYLPDKALLRKWRRKWRG